MAVAPSIAVFVFRCSWRCSCKPMVIQLYLRIAHAAVPHGGAPDCKNQGLLDTRELVDTSYLREFSTAFQLQHGQQHRWYASNLGSANTKHASGCVLPAVPPSVALPPSPPAPPVDCSLKALRLNASDPPPTSARSPTSHPRTFPTPDGPQMTRGLRLAASPPAALPAVQVTVLLR